MKPGTIVELPDGRRGTVVYHGIDGDGIMWGEHNVTEDDLLGHGGLDGSEAMPEGYEYAAEAMLRDDYPHATIECVGEDYEIIPSSMMEARAKGGEDDG